MFVHLSFRYTDNAHFTLHIFTVHVVSPKAEGISLGLVSLCQGKSRALDHGRGGGDERDEMVFHLPCSPLGVCVCVCVCVCVWVGGWVRVLECTHTMQAHCIVLVRHMNCTVTNNNTIA